MVHIDLVTVHNHLRTEYESGPVRLHVDVFGSEGVLAGRLVSDLGRVCKCKKEFNLLQIRSTASRAGCSKQLNPSL